MRASSRASGLGVALVLVACVAGPGCGRPPAPVPSVPASSAAPVAQPVSVADATTLVQQFYSLMAGGKAASAAALWTADWQRAHPQAAWAASPPVPPGAVAQIGQVQARPDGTVYVPVTAIVQGPAGRRWADAGYVVGRDAAGRVALLAGGVQAPLAPLDLQSITNPLPGGGSGGEAICGAYGVQWSVQPDRTSGDGMVSTLTITGPDGKAVPPPPIPPFSFGTWPTACGDLLGDGGTELVLTTATSTEGAYRQASVYVVAPNGTRLIGQMASEGEPTYPRPESPDGLYPYVMATSREVDDVGAGPILATSFWAYGGLAYERATDHFPAVLRADRDARLARLKAGEKCSASPPVCEAPDLLLAYYDDRLLGEGESGLKALQALLPKAADRTWLQQQADVVAFRMSLP